MLTATGFGRSGLQDWLFQRITAVIIFAYFTYLAVFIVTHQPMTYVLWQELFQIPWLKPLTLVVYISFAIHAWIGMWTVSTDYIPIAWLRLLLQGAMKFALIFMLFWLCQILWSN